MEARTCDGRHRANKRCPDPECYLHSPEIDASPEGLRATVERLAEVATPTPLEVTHVDREQGVLELAPGSGEDVEQYAVGPTVEVPLPRDELVVDDDTPEGIARALREMAAVPPMHERDRDLLHVGAGVFRWLATRDGGYQRSEYAHALPPAPVGWRWSSAQVTAVGGRGKLHVSAAVTNGTEGEGAETGPQALVIEITGRGGYCTGLDVLLFARPV